MISYGAWRVWVLERIATIISERIRHWRGRRWYMRLWEEPDIPQCIAIFFVIHGDVFSARECLVADGGDWNSGNKSPINCLVQSAPIRLVRPRLISWYTATTAFREDSKPAACYRSYQHQKRKETDSFVETQFVKSPARRTRRWNSHCRHQWIS